MANKYKKQDKRLVQIVSTDIKPEDNKIIFEITQPKKIISFDDFWMWVKIRYNIDREMKDIIKNHMVTRGYKIDNMDQLEFVKALADYGIK